MKIALAQLNFHIGNFEANEEKIIASIERGKREGADLVVFAELSICGYPPRDFLEFDDFIEHCEHSIEKISKHCHGISAIVGSPVRTHQNKGKKLHNGALLISEGKVQAVHHKQLLPTYDVFDENRYFEPGSVARCMELNGERFALNICEDLWNVEGQYRHTKSPMESQQKEQPDFIINIAASPFSVNQQNHRKQVFDYQVRKNGIPLLYVNHVGAQTELIFDGNSTLIDQNGEVAISMKAFEEDFQIMDSKDWVRSSPVPAQSKYQSIENALVLGIRDYFKKLNFKTATLGLSGGIDSALTLVLAVKALGADCVHPILMPSQFSSDHSVDDSIALCKKLNCNYHQIPIEQIFASFQKELDPLFQHTEFDLTEENIQSRIRGTLLMAYTNKFGAILLNTSNKSELAVGYGTLYGDMAGGISVLGDLYKTEVFDLSKFLNESEEIIPSNIINKPPSAELRPNQKDSDSLPDYEDLDRILKLYLEDHLSPRNIIDRGNEEKLVRDTLRMVNINEYKRHQAPPILRVSDKAFGMGRRIPIVGKYLS